MNPVVIEVGPVVLHAYTAWLMGGILMGLGVIAWRAYRYDPASVTRWLDVGIAGVVGGVIGARLLYVALTWEYFADHTGEIAKISSGGMAWHGGLLIGIPAVLVVARLRRVPLRPWTDAAALAWPLGLSAAWVACCHAGSGYGYEVQTLADWPGWLVKELPDVYGLVAPRLDVQLAGALFGEVLLVLALVLTWGGWLPGVRVWLVLALTSLGMALLGFFRADPARLLIHHRADQVFDLVLLLLSTVTGSMIWLLDRRAKTARIEGG
jgi:phosphatidylglycerol:prolipoprotein diacylglycerol transferase